MICRCLILAAAFAAAAPSARGGFVLGTTPSSAPPGGTGTFDVTLTVDSGPPVDVAGFGFRLTFATPGFQFASVEYGPDYLFDGVSLAQFFGDPGPAPGFDPMLTPTTVDANDVAFDQLGLIEFVTVSPGHSFTLARIEYAIDAGVSPGTSAGLAFNPMLTSVSPFGGAAVPPTLLVGPIIASGSRVPAVPTPATVTVLLAAAAGLVVGRRPDGSGRTCYR